MNILIILVPLALLLGLFFLYSFLWASQNDQFDDLETPAMKVLIEDNEKKEK